MNISVINYETNGVAVEISIEITDGVYKINSIINDDKFDQVPEDLKFIRTRWLTFYLNHLHEDKEKEMENGIMEDIRIMLEHDVKYYNIIGGTYKIKEQ